ncbi:hypothetical protein LCGC14_2575800 [marine sediment metagenome]|uniref:SWIM-type domain-containing protein n=1 Tax=marine sediment metagenome TaxID=412755 RepID=A0A0F9CS23_9ZZZZ
MNVAQLEGAQVFTVKHTGSVHLVVVLPSLTDQLAMSCTCLAGINRTKTCKHRDAVLANIKGETP